MEGSIFPAAAVAAELENYYVEARLHCDLGPTARKYRALAKEMTGNIANPYFAIVDPRTGEKISQHPQATVAQFAAFLREAREKVAQVESAGASVDERGRNELPGVPTALEELDGGAAQDMLASAALPAEREVIADDYKAALRVAADEKKLLFVNFSARNSPVAKIMEGEVLPDERVAAELENGFVEARLHCDIGPRAAAHTALQKRLAGNVASPYFAVVDPVTGEVVSTRAQGTPAQMATFLADARGDR